MDEDLAEFVGFFIGDGCLSKSRSTGVLLLTGAAKRQSEEYFLHLNKILMENFNGCGNVYHRRDSDVFLLRVYNKKILGFFLKLGYSYGPKSNTVFIPEEIIRERRLSTACLRGIFNSDGSIYRRYSKAYGKHKRHYKDYFNVQFKSNSKTLVEQIKSILEREEIFTNKIIVDNKAFVLRITSQKMVGKFLDTININHPYHIERIKSGPRGI
ncbi:hypothetical protein HOF78_04000 [Candidatus Woesearchaeota archaeon]|jgi:DNA-binding transcriptional regulator WhiA|nr:hypothetical protein [Candidatus Woesearchaeota archaeon]MBT6044476.1 hypothetical protein [Candidatus Woesearchaeota archaeon]